MDLAGGEEIRQLAESSPNQADNDVSNRTIDFVEKYLPPAMQGAALVEQLGGDSDFKQTLIDILRSQLEERLRQAALSELQQFTKQEIEDIDARLEKFAPGDYIARDELMREKFLITVALESSQFLEQMRPTLQGLYVDEQVALQFLATMTKLLSAEEDRLAQVIASAQNDQQQKLAFVAVRQRQLQQVRQINQKFQAIQRNKDKVVWAAVILNLLILLGAVVKSEDDDDKKKGVQEESEAVSTHPKYDVKPTTGGKFGLFNKDGTPVVEKGQTTQRMFNTQQEATKWLDLASDPAVGRLRPDEAATAFRVEAQEQVNLQRYTPPPGGK